MDKIFTDDSFKKEVLDSAEPVLVDFWAPWCGPCRVQSPIVEALAKELEGQPVKVGKMNVDENPATAGTFGIMSIPTIMIFKGGKPAEVMVGLTAQPALKAKIFKYLNI